MEKFPWALLGLCFFSLDFNKTFVFQSDLEWFVSSMNSHKPKDLQAT